MIRKVIIRVEHLHKTYGDTVAVDDVSFEVYEGEIFGMVGPNGAGKTTTTECLSGLRTPGSGRLEVFGMNPQSENVELRNRIGVQLQTSALQDRLKVWEALDLFASFYPHTLPQEALLEQFGLAEKRNARFGKLSGGQKQRLFIALALINDPALVFLDELTTGLDPQARHAMWDMVRGIRERGKTVFLTTHFMEEAERLCDRVAIVDHGRLIALDTPGNLIRSINAENRVVFTVEEKFDTQALAQLREVTRVGANGERVVAHGKSNQVVVDVVTLLVSNGYRFRDLHTEQPNLEDVFMALTGHEMRD